MKIRYIVWLGSIPFALLQACGGQGFVNLDFEDANVSGYVPGSSDVPVADAFPGWSASYSNPNTGTVNSASVWYDALSLGGAFISIDDTKGPPYSSLGTLDGDYSAYLFGGEGLTGASTSSTLSQTGLVPIGTKSLVFSVRLGPTGIPLVVSVDGSPIPGTPGSGYDISAFAGQTVTLSFTEPPPEGIPPSFAILDDISFSPDPVPEPSTSGLITTSILILCLRMVWPNKAWSQRQNNLKLTRYA